MRRSCALLLALILLLVPSLTGTAYAQSRDPLARAISALKSEFAKQSSVLFSRRIHQSVALEVAYGKHRFAPKVGVYASDMSETFTTGGDPSRFRMINIGRDTYTQDDTADLPKGKKWSHWRDKDGFLWSQDLVDALNTEFLRMISSGAKRISTGDRYDGVRTTRYDGSVKVESIGLRAAGIYYDMEKDPSADSRIEWKLWLGPDGLPRRFQAKMPFGPLGPEMITLRMNVLYKKWGSPVRIVAPPKRLVVEAA